MSTFVNIVKPYLCFNEKLHYACDENISIDSTCLCHLEQLATFILQAKIRRRRKSKNSEGGKTGNAYTDDEGFGSCTEAPTNGPESLNLSLNGNLSAPNTVSHIPTTPVTPTGKRYDENL